jgi:putative flippase GtrA
MTREHWRTTGLRWLKFNAVGGIGIVVQLLVLTALKLGLHFNYLLATAVAVETAVVHNFYWHERFTWSDRPVNCRFPRFLKFNLTTGLLSIAGNLLLTKFLVEVLAIQFLAANGMAIAICALFNFVVSDHFVFRAQKPKPLKA